MFESVIKHCKAPAKPASNNKVPTKPVPNHKAPAKPVPRSTTATKPPVLNTTTIRKTKTPALLVGAGLAGALQWDT